MPTKKAANLAAFFVSRQARLVEPVMPPKVRVGRAAHIEVHRTVLTRENVHPRHKNHMIHEGFDDLT